MLTYTHAHCLLTCRANSCSANASENCTCAAGFEFQVLRHPMQNCSACAPGTFRNDSMLACESCPATVRETHTANGVILVASEPSPAGDECLPVFVGCPGGSYQPRNDSESCCSLGHVWSNISQTCIPCPAGTFFNQSLLACTDCGPGSYSADNAVLNCSSCENGTFAAARQTSCLACPINSTGPTGATSVSECTCVGGTARVSLAEGPSICTVCLPGTYMVVPHNHTLTTAYSSPMYAHVHSKDAEAWCDRCTYDKWSYTNSLKCTCAPNWYQNGSWIGSAGESSNSTFKGNWVPEQYCDKCPDGTVSYMENNTAEEGMLKGIDACACPAGFVAPNSRAGQAGCGHDKWCGDPCKGMCPATTTTPMPTTTPSPVLMSNNASSAGNQSFRETTATFRETTSSLQSITTQLPATTPSPVCMDSNTTTAFRETTNISSHLWYTETSANFSQCRTHFDHTITVDRETTTSTPLPTPVSTPTPKLEHSYVHWHAGSPMEMHLHQYSAPEPLSYCVDANECSAAPTVEDWLGSPYTAHRCHANATCVNTYGSYTCHCNSGTYGNGLSCEPCLAFSTSGYAATSLAECQCMKGLQCGQEEVFNGTGSSNGTLLSELSDVILGGAISLAFYVQPLSMGASAFELSRGAPARELPLSECDLAAVQDFVYAASKFNVNSRAPGPIGANQSLWNCTLEGALPNMSASTDIKPQVLLELGAEGGNDIVRVRLDEMHRIVYEVLPRCSCYRCLGVWVSNVSLPLFAWSHVAIVHQQGGEVEIYLNGSLEANIPEMGGNAKTDDLYLNKSYVTECADYSGWFDKGGYNCAWYAESATRCDIAPLFPNVLGEWFGVDATFACCACQGGISTPKAVPSSGRLQLSKSEIISRSLEYINRRPVAREVERRLCVLGASLAQPEIYHPFHGKLLDVAIWNASLTASEVSLLSDPAPRPLLRPEVLSLRKFSTICDKGKFVGNSSWWVGADGNGWVTGSGRWVGDQDWNWRCVDVDECWENSSGTSKPVCSENSVCTNTWGSYTCSCLSGYYMSANGTCHECVNANSRFGSIDVTDCKCNAGYTGEDGQECTACAPGLYKDQYGSVTCSQCPDNSFSLTGGSHISSCICNKGFTGPDGGPCVACVPGLFKDSNGSTPCSACGAGKFSLISGSFNESDCMDCGMGKYAIPTEWGPTLGATACKDCVAGTFSITTGNIEEGNCIKCIAGKFSTAIGANSSSYCTDCESGKYSVVVGASSSETCSSCPAHALSPQGSDQITDCICNSGYTGPNGGAQVILSKTCASNATSSPACQVVFSSLPPGSNPTITIEIANSNFWMQRNYVSKVIVSAKTIAQDLLQQDGQDGKCSEVSMIVNRTSVPMLLNFSNTTQCVDYSGWTDSAGYGCAWYAESQSRCNIAPLYPNALGVNATSACCACAGGNSTVVVAATGEVPVRIETAASWECQDESCVECEGYTLYARVSIWVDGHACSECIPGTFKDVNGSAPCSLCSQGKFSTRTAATSNATCTDCAAGTYAEAQGTVRCDVCAAGKFAEESGFSACTSCLPSSYQNSTNMTSCIFCPNNPDGSRTYSSPASTSIFNCTNKLSGIEASISVDTGSSNVEAYEANFRQCIATISGADLRTVEALSSVNTSLPNSTLKLRLAVPRFFSEHAQGGLSSLSACSSLQDLFSLTLNEVFATCGSGREPYGSGCRECELGFYKKYWDNSSCVKCPQNSTTLPAVQSGALLLSQCTCNAGYFSTDLLGANSYFSPSALGFEPGYFSSELQGFNPIENISCLECGLGHQCAGIQHRVPCRPGWYAATSTQSACNQCVPGKYSMVNGSSSCTDCIAGKYSSALAANSSSTCVACPNHTFSLSGTDNITGCICNKGYFGPDGHECVACAAGKFKDVNGSAATATHDCQDCIAGKYSNTSAANSSNACVACPSGKTSNASSDGLEDCGP